MDGEVNEKLLKDFLFAVRGLKKRLYAHSNMPTTKDPRGPKMSMHRCMVCQRSAIGDAEIEHHKRCPLDRTQETWHRLKEQRPDLFDFTEYFPKAAAAEESAGQAPEVVTGAPEDVPLAK